MKKFSYLPIALLLSTLSACSGGGDDNDSFEAIAGRWSGDLFQSSGLNCSDGTFVGAGAGSNAGTIALEISGGDLLGETSTLTVTEHICANPEVEACGVPAGGACVYSGVRLSESEIEFHSDDANCNQSVVLDSINNGQASVHFDPRPAVALPDGSPTCAIAYAGEVERE